LDLSTLLDVENAALAPSQGHQRPRLAARRRRTIVIERMDHVDAAVAGLRAHGAEPVGEMAQYQDSYRLC
jgi:hypothetical protein